MLTIPANFARSMRDVSGPDGEAWLGRLPGVVQACADRWSLAVVEPFQPLSYNWVAPATRPGLPSSTSMYSLTFGRRSFTRATRSPSDEWYTSASASELSSR